ncbi:MAG: 4-hydroxybenzoate octaprenyltransferase [Reyranellaceae bacterium]
MASPGPAHTDIRREHWTQRLLPPRWRPFARLARWDRPIGIWLLLFPCWWSLAMAWDGARASLGPLALQFLLFAIGAVAMRGAGCTWNDILDRDVDARVERTRGRPLPAGEIAVRAALVFLVVQALVGLAVLLSFPPFAIVVGAASLLVVAVYPLMKRLTDWPQVVLGFAFNWGALLGWAVLRDEIGWPAVALYAGGIAWTLVYDTIYAMQDQRDDAIVGVRSTARRFAGQPRRWLSAFAVLTLVLFALSIHLAGLGWPAWIGLAAAAAHLLWQIATLKTHDPADCLKKFQANRHLGWLLLAGLLAGRAVA